MTGSQARPSVSVVIPCFNGEDTLAETVASVIGQSYADWETIIVNDGSTDQSAMIADHLGRTDARIRHVKTPNGGVAAARNVGLQLARGEFVAFLDADDIWHPEFLTRQLAAMAMSEPPAGLSYCHLRHIDAQSRIVQTRPAHVLSGRVAASMIYFNFCGNPSCVMFRTAALRETGGYEVELRRLGIEGSEDFLLHLIVACQFPVAVVPEYLVGYRLSASSMSADLRRMAKSNDHAVTLFLDQFAPLTVPPQVVRWREGARALRMVQLEFLAGHYRAMARVLWIACTHDPVRNGLVIVAKIPAALRRLWRWAIPGRGARPLFANVDPRKMGIQMSALHTLPFSVIDRRLRAIAADTAWHLP